MSGFIIRDLADLQGYQRWFKKCRCVGCGKRQADRPRDKDGRCLDRWATEELCLDCLKAGVKPPRYEERPW